MRGAIGIIIVVIIIIMVIISKTFVTVLTVCL